MLPKINRLKKRSDFDGVFKKGKGVKEDFLFLKLAKNNLGVSRFGFVVSRKISTKATARNKIKKRLKEAVKALLPETKKGFDGVLVAQKNSGNKGYKETERAVASLFKKAKMI